MVNTNGQAQILATLFLPGNLFSQILFAHENKLVYHYYKYGKSDPNIKWSEEINQFSPEWKTTLSKIDFLEEKANLTVSVWMDFPSN